MSTAALVGGSSRTRALDEEISLAARSDAKVLITGESGVGKEVAAQLVHARSARSQSPLITVNCAGVPETLLESEFFGHVRGSFTGAYRDRPGFLERADRGTVFLDEIGEMSLRLQGLLLRFLETGEVQRIGATHTDRHVNVRVIAASNRDLETEVEKKTFREDLFYRVNVVRLRVPALRERREDIPLLARHFVEQFSHQYGVGRVDIDPGVLNAFSTYDWPGNVRELRNVIERTMIRLNGHTMTVVDLPRELWGAPVSVAAPDLAAPSQPAASEELFDRMVNGGQSFWSAIYEPFMARDVTRDQIRQVVLHGLVRTSGDYQGLARLFNIPASDYKRFIAMLRRYDCHVALQPLRKRIMKAEPPRTLRFGTDS